jgi:hypothetical protein
MHAARLMPSICLSGPLPVKVQQPSAPVATFFGDAALGVFAVFFFDGLLMVALLKKEQSKIALDLEAIEFMSA